MNDNSFNNMNSFSNGMNNNFNNTQGQFNNINMMQENNNPNMQNLEMNNMGQNMGENQFFNNQPGDIQQPEPPADMMVGPNPFANFNNYENSFNESDVTSNTVQQTTNVFTNNDVQTETSLEANSLAGVNIDRMTQNGSTSPIENNIPIQNMSPTQNSNIQTAFTEQPITNSIIENTTAPLEAKSPINGNMIKESSVAPIETTPIDATSKEEQIVQQMNTPVQSPIKGPNQTEEFTQEQITPKQSTPVEYSINEANALETEDTRAEANLTEAEEVVVETSPKQVVIEETPKEPIEDIVPEGDMTAAYNTFEFESRFGIDYEKAISKNEAIFKGLKYRITVLSEILIRLEYSESGTFEDRPTELAKFRAFEVPNIEVTDEEKTLILKTSYFELIYEKERPFTGTKFSPDQYLKIKLLDTDKTWFFSQAEARNFRSTCTSLDDKYSLPKLEKGLYSTDGFVSLDDSKTLIFNQDGSVGKRSDARIDTYVFMYKKDFGFCLKDYYKLTGYPPLIPRYALGVWWNRDEIYDVNGIYSLLTKFKKNEIPISVLLLNKWSKNDVSFDREQIPEPKNVIDDLHKEGIRLGLGLHLKSVPATQNGVVVEAPFNVYDRGFMGNYFNTFIKPLNEMGVDFYSLENRGEDKQVLRMINYYFYKYMNSEPNKRGMILSRNGLIASHLYPIHNSGEIIVDWRTLKMIPEFNSTSSNLGISWWSHAIGGYKDGVEENELYTRFVELGTYSPIFRFSSAHGHYYKREPWKWDVKTRKIVKDYTNLRHKLIPYLYSESYKYSKTGLPLIQPLYYRYPELYDEPTYRNEYYFGTELFIAPITERKDQVMNRTVVKLFLPNGIWYDFKTGKKFPGGKRYISFFQDEDYPVFAKQGAIIPLADIEESNRNFTGNPESMEIHIFPGKNNTYKLYEDDGTTNAYQKGDYMTSVIDYNYLPNNYTVIIRPLEGREGIIPPKRKYKLRFRNTRFADDVIVYVGSERIQVKSYLDDQDFIVEVPPISTSVQLSVNCKGKDIEIDAVRIINEDIDTIISDLKIPTRLKEQVSEIMFSEKENKKKRIEIRKLSSHGLNDIFIKMFLKLLEYVGEF